MGRAGGWLGRAQRLLIAQGGECVERGVCAAAVIEQEAGGEAGTAAAATAGEAAAIGERFGDPDLFALAAHERGHILIRNGRLKEGLRLLGRGDGGDDRDELSPIVSGIVDRGVILACQDAHEVRRAGEWTVALTRWCERQPELWCSRGAAWCTAPRSCGSRGVVGGARGGAASAPSVAGGREPGGSGRGLLPEAEIHRLLGDFHAAEEAYREAEPPVGSRSRGSPFCGWRRAGLKLPRLRSAE